MTTMISRILCGASALALCLMSQTAHAQDGAATTAQRGPETIAAATGDEDVGQAEIVVTGSRIRRDPLAEPTPVTIVDQATIARTGLSAIADVLQRLPSSGGGINTKFNNSSNVGNPPDGGGVSAGSAEIDLRYLGAKRTLVLVDGLRYVNGTAGTGIPASVDLNTIPLNMIDRVEVLQSAATPLYGSDAIAGVVNIITKASQVGLQASAQFGTFRQGDGETQDYNVSYGFKGPSTNVVLGASYVKQQEVRSSARAISRFSRPFVTSCIEGGCVSDTDLGRFVVNDFGNPANEAGLDLTLRAPVSGRARFDRLDPTSANSDFKTQTEADYYNIQPFNYILTPSERYSLWISVRQEISDNTNLRVRAVYNHRDSANQAAPVPLGTGPGARNGNLLDRVSIDVTNPFNPFGVTLSAGAAGDPPANYQFVSRRLVEAGGRFHTQTAETVSLTATLDGSFALLGRRWYWDTSALVGMNDAKHVLFNNVNAERVQQALGPIGSCTAPCVPLNLFSGPGSITTEMLSFINFDQRDRSRQDLFDFTANISGDLFDLPAGPVGVAIGYEHRDQRGSFDSDPIVAAGLGADIPAGSYRGRFNVDEIYGELRVPILSDVPGFRSLEATGTVRHSNYSTFGSSTSFTGSALWKPVSDLLLRGSYAESLRAPSIGELNGTLTRFDSVLADPCNDFNGTLGGAPASPTVRANCIANGVPANGSFRVPTTAIPVITGGNTALRPETSRTLLFGGVYSPRWARNSAIASALSIEANYYDIKLNDAIAAVGADLLLDRCAQVGDPQSCGTITRGTTGFINQISALLTNIGGIRTRGLDVNLNYRTPRTGLGTFGLNVYTTTLLAYRESVPISTGFLSVNRRGAERGSPDQAFPKFKANAVLDWAIGDISASITGRYIGGVTESQNDNRLGARFYGDLQFGYVPSLLDGRVTLTAGVNNLFDQDPPGCFSCTINSYDPTTYDVPGQFGYLRLSYRM